MSYTISHSSGRLSSKLKIHDSFFVAKRKKTTDFSTEKGKKKEEKCGEHESNVGLALYRLID